MLRTGIRTVIIILAILVLSTCIDPYIPILRGYQSLLVVEGLITDENSSFAIKLSRTMENDSSPEMVTGANIFITDNLGTISILKSEGNGIFRTDSTVFRGIVGRTYKLHINTYDGEKYESDNCFMQAVPDIDRIYFIKDQDYTNNKTVASSGIRIYIDSEPGDNNNYYRWGIEETWKFRIPTPKRFDYVDSKTFIPLKNVKQYCWKTSKPKDIITNSSFSGNGDHITKEPILFIASDKSDRLMINYSILVKQYSVSKNEYSFWENLKQVSENGGDIFAALPFSVISNIHNVNKPGERVLGYFEVSAVKQKRLFISFKEFLALKLPFYHYNSCERIEKSPADYPSGPFNPPLTWDQLYEMYCVNSNYIFVEPKYSDDFSLDKLVFTTPECSNCELTGTGTPPDFWPKDDL